MDKASLRKRLLSRRDALTPADVLSSSQAITENLWPVIKDLQSFFAYFSFGNEIYTHDLIEKLLEHDKIVTVPKVIGNCNMRPVHINSLDEVQIGPYGFPEPGLDTPYEGTLDVCIAPCVGFTDQRYRLGMGFGSYDRFLAKNKMQSIVLAYDFQRLPEMPVEAHDQLVDIVVTESGVIRR